MDGTKTARKEPRKPTSRRKDSENGHGIIDRQVPFSAEAERAVLGSIMVMPEVCDELANELRADDFYDPAHRTLYEHLWELYTGGSRIDIALLRERLINAGVYEQLGGAAYLAEVFTSVPHAGHARYYAKIVRQKSTCRALIEACTDVLQEAYEAPEETDRLLSQAEQRVFAIHETHSPNTVSTLDVVLHEALDRLDKRLSGENVEGAIESGFTDLDVLMGGLHASELLILAARPSMGKTALAMNIAEHVASKLNMGVLFVSLEMAAIELVERLLCSSARVNLQKLRNGRTNAEEQKKLVQKSSELSRVPLFIDDAPSRTVAQIAANARRIRRKKSPDLGLVVIDYLQLIEPENPSDPRQEQVARIARRLKGLARELRVPVLCLAQLNRQAEDSRDHIPRLSHLRESGAIEQDADVVMFVHREEYYRHGEDRDEVAGEAQLIVAKQRNGPTDIVDLTWVKEFTRFENRARQRHTEFDEFSGLD